MGRVIVVATATRMYVARHGMRHANVLHGPWTCRDLPCYLLSKQEPTQAKISTHQPQLVDAPVSVGFASWLRS